MTGIRTRSIVQWAWYVLYFSVQHPLLLFALTAGFSAHGSIAVKLSLLPASYFLTACVGIVVGNMQQKTMLHQLLTFLREFSPDYSFYKCPIETEFGSEEALNLALEVMRGERPGYAITGKPLGWIIYFHRCAGTRIPAAFQAFPITGAPFYLILADRPCEMTPIQIFRLLHEIGHLTLPHLAVKEGKAAAYVEYLCLLIMVTVLVGPEPLAACAVVCAFAIWRSTFNHDPITFEELADAYATLYMVVHSTFSEIIREYKAEIEFELRRAKRYTEKNIQRRLSNIDAAAAEARPEGDHPHTRYSVRTMILLPRWPILVSLVLLLGWLGIHVSALAWRQLIMIVAAIGCSLLIVGFSIGRRIRQLEGEVDAVVEVR